jgi:hypothetical protein
MQVGGQPYGAAQAQQDEAKLNKPLKKWSDMTTSEKFTGALGAIRRDPLDFLGQTVNVYLKAAHDTGEKFMQNTLQTEEQGYEHLQQHYIAIIGDPHSSDEQKALARKYLDRIQNSPWNKLKRKYDPTTFLQAAGTSFVDWYSMGALFKPIEALEAVPAVERSAKLRAALHSTNIALGTKFGYDSAKQGVDQWNRGEYGQAMTSFGNAIALPVMAVLGVASKEANLKGQALRDEAANQLEEVKQKQQAAAAKNPNTVFPHSELDINRAQDILRSGNPLDIMASLGPDDERTALRIRESIHKEKLRQANLETERQRIQPTRLEKTISGEEEITAKQSAMLDKDLAESDRQSAELRKKLDAEKANVPAGTGIRKLLEEPPAPEKRPYQEPAQIVRGRQPLSPEEREQARYDERVEEVKKELADERQRRLQIANKALHQGLDTEERQLTSIAEDRERRLREGQDFKVEDRRGQFEPPAPPSPLLDPPPVATEASIRDLEHHEAAATWAILENQKKLAQSEGRSEDEIEQVRKELEDNKQLLEDVRQERIAAQSARTAPKLRESGDQLAGVNGNKSVLKTVTRDIPITYRVVEGEGLKTSHNATSFEPVAGYPEGVQERDYKNDKDAQVAVIDHTQNYDPAFTISDSPGPEHGPPIVTPDGIVLGGNSRAMSTMRLYGADGDSSYRAALMAKAAQFGIDPEQIAAMKNPVLVREVTDPPKTIQELRALGSDLNKVFTRELGEYEQAVSAGKRISQETLDFVANQLGEMGEGSTLRDLLRERGTSILEKMYADGVIAPTERRAFIDDQTGALNERGKDFFERALLGAAIDDPLVLANAPRGVLRKVERAIGSIVKIKSQGGDWDISDYLKQAIRDHITAARQGVDVKDLYAPPKQQSFLVDTIVHYWKWEPPHPIVEALSLTLDKNGSEVKKEFENYAKDAVPNLFEKVDPWEAFNRNFHAKVRPDEWGTLRARSEATEPMEPTPEKETKPSKLEEKKSQLREDLKMLEKDLADIKARGKEAVDEIYSEDELTEEDKEGEGSLDKTVGIYEEEIAATRKELESLGDRPKPVSKETSGRDAFRAELERAFPDVTPPQLDATMALIDARAKAVGMDADGWIKSKIAGVEKQASEKGPRAQVEFLEDGRAVLRAMRSPHVAALVHEIGHIFRRDLAPEEAAIAARWAGAQKDEPWSVAAEEKFAKGFERYLQNGESPSPGLAGVFRKFRGWLTDIYQRFRTARRGNTDVKLSATMAKLFDRMFTGPEPLEVTPEERVEPTATSLIDTKNMTDTDLRAAVDSIESQMNRPISKEAKARLRDQAEPFKKELSKRVSASAKGERDLSVVFPKDEANAAMDRLKKRKPNVTLNYSDSKDELEKKAREDFPRIEEGEYPERSYILSNGDIHSADDNDHFQVSKYYEGDYRDKLEDEQGIKRFLDDTGAVRTGYYDGTFLIHLGKNIPTQEQFEAIAGSLNDYGPLIQEKIIIETPFGSKDLPDFANPGQVRREIENLFAKKKGRKTLNYTDDEEDTINDLASVMGHLFENGHRDFDSNSAHVIKHIGEWIRPYTKPAWNKMLADGRARAQAKLDAIIPEQDRRKYSEQLGLFETQEQKDRRIELPPGVEVRREAPQKELGPNNVRKELDARPGTEGRSQAGRTNEGSNRSVRSEPLGTSGRGVRNTGESRRVPGVTEETARQIRTVKPPELDVPVIPSGNNAVIDSAQWAKNLEDANLPKGLPAPTRSLTPSIEKKLIFKGQPEIVQTALTSLDKYHSFILASSTGTGKTYTGSAIMAELQPKYGLILTPGSNLHKNWIDTAQEFGLELKKLPASGAPTEPGIYISTYGSAASAKGVDKFNWGLVLADESHKARRWHADTGAGKLLRTMAPASDNMIYTSATPFSSALELGYMEKLGLWKDQGLENWLAKEFNTRKSAETGNWISPFNPRKLAALRQELVNRGMMVNMDRDMRGYDVNFAIAPLSQENQQSVRNIVKGFNLAADYFSRKGFGNMVMGVKGNAVTFMKSYLERARLPEAIELGKKLEKEGWKVAYFTETKKEVPEIYDFIKPADQFYGGEISRLLPKLPGVVETLKEAFGDDIANFTGPHGTGRQEELDAFNRGDKKHIIATYGAGGLGISMHDLSGTAPRAAIYLGPPYSGVMLDQAIGRPWRFGSKSNVNAYFLTSNATPEMNLLFKKILPRFESLKASVSGVHKNDPIVSGMKSLDALLDYEFGNKDKTAVGDYLGTVDTNAISNVKEIQVPSAENAKNKGMQVERRLPLEPPSTLHYKDAPPADLPMPEDDAAESAKAVRRPFVSKETEKTINDPRLLDRLNEINRQWLGMKPEEKEPPKPIDEIVGERTIPPPGHADVPQYDMADPKWVRKGYEWAKERWPNLPEREVVSLGKNTRGILGGLAKIHTAPYVLKQHEITAELPKRLQTVEMHYRQRVADTRYEKNRILGSLVNDEAALRRVFQALRRAHDPARELQGAQLEGMERTFTDEELRVAQRLRDEILEPIINDVQAVRPDVGKRMRYAPLVRQIDEIASTLYPELNGKIPADLVPDFSLEVRQSLTKDPFSPHMLKRKSTPPKDLNINEVLDAYIPSMLKVAELTKESRRTAVFLNNLPESALKDYATKYARVFFGVPGEYKHLDKLTYDISKNIAKLSYSAALDLNPSWFLLHSTKIPFNVWPELGKNSSKYVSLGLAGMTSPSGHELVARSGVLLDTPWQIAKPRTRIGKVFSNVMHSGMILSDRLDRGVAYLGGLEKAKDMGLLGDPEKVGKITKARLDELAAEGIDVQKAYDYAYGVVARSNYMYTNANVQFFVREHPLMGMFKSYMVRQAEYFNNIRKLANEVKAQGNMADEFVAMKEANGEYEYTDARAKWRRLVFSAFVAAIGAIGMANAGISQRIFPYHISALLSPPIVFGYDTVNLINKTVEGKATENDWIKWMKEGARTFSAFGRMAFSRDDNEKKEKQKYQIEPLPRVKYMDPVPR